MVATKKINKEEAVEAEVISESSEPKKPSKKENVQCCAKGGGSGKFFWGMFLVVLGVMFALENYLQIDVWQNLWPIIIIIIGLSIVFGSFSKGKE